MSTQQRWHRRYVKSKGSIRKTRLATISVPASAMSLFGCPLMICPSLELPLLQLEEKYLADQSEAELGHYFFS